MDKPKLHSPDLTQSNIERLAELFPGCVTEARDDNGKLKKAIDFDQLRQELSDHIVEGPQERYHLNWPGKREALLAANAPIAKTLRPCREESVDFDTTKNLFIEGDNLDALKLLQETYLNKIKMIYIDPPYNTGNDFIYKDNFSESTQKYLVRTAQDNAEIGRLVSNSERNGRFHSDWLTMIYARLKLARNVLRDDGVIFASIDDGEYANLKRVMDEIFGEHNFIETFVWHKKTAPNNVVIGSVHEYVICFAKDKSEVDLMLLPRDASKDTSYKNPDNDPRGRWKPDNLTAAAKGGRVTKSLVYRLVNPETGQEHFPPEGRMWAVPRDAMLEKIKAGTVYWGKNGNGKPMDKRFLAETRDGTVASTMLNDVGTNSSASKQLNKLFDGSVVFETPKPIELISRLAQLALRDDQIVLDFYSGSCSTAHATIDLNARDGLKRKFIMVQLPECCGEGSAAAKAGFKTIADVGKERIRRAEKNLGDTFGYRVLKVATSNMKDVHYTPDTITQDDLYGQIDNIKPDRSGEDLLFQVMLDWGLDLALPISVETIAGKTVYFVDGDDLAACFETGIDEAFVKQLAQRKPLRAVFRDTGYGSDNAKINVAQIFRLISPNTDVKSI